MNAYRATALAEGFEDGTDEEIDEAWQYLIDSGLCYQLQGWFGREAAARIEAGLSQPPKKVSQINFGSQD